MRMIGLIMELPEGKRAGYYAQAVKALAEAARIVDRDKELLVLENESDRDRALWVLAKYRIPAEETALIALPEAPEPPEPPEELGFRTRAGRVFLYMDLTAGFRLPAGGVPEADAADRAALLEQLREHIVYEYASEDGTPVYVCEPHLREAVEGIARRYGAGVRFLW